MSITVVVSFQVGDSDNSKAVFDGYKSNREEAGIHATTFKDLGDPNRAHVIATVPSKEDFEAFFRIQSYNEEFKILG